MKNPRPFARKRFGQHFLRDRSVLDSIIFHSNLSQEDHVLEIGPGKGALTDRLLEQCGSVTAVEIDRDLTSDLREKYEGEERLTLLERDILKMDWDQLVKEEETNKIVANLPYNISSPLFFKIVAFRQRFHSIVIMVQKELALRIQNDGKGKKLKDYGILSVIASNLFDVEWIRDVSSACFVPQPKVDSAVIKLTPKPLNIQNERAFLGFVRRSFNHRRKRLLTHLKNNEPVLYQSMDSDTIETMREYRPENLLPSQYLSLFQKGRI